MHKMKCWSTRPKPTITCYLPQHNPLGIGLVILPGGGYNHLAEHEGKGYAEYFRNAGIACFVVSYRLGPAGFRHPAMLEDALEAMRRVRSAAHEYKLYPHRIGILGSSAGGHLAAHALTAWNNYESEVSLRPNFGILCYPVITSSPPHGHVGSMRQLVGDNPSTEALEILACETHVTPDTPPCFLWHTGEDTAVPLENSVMFAMALRRQGVPFELHLYQEGRHGMGLNAPFDWGGACLRWLNALMKE